MIPTDEFDAFYVETRAALLVQCYALTGDLTSSRRAVRDAFVAAWHHWRKLERRCAQARADAAAPTAADAATETTGAVGGSGPDAGVRALEEWVRPLAWRLATRRHTARLWHRERDIDPDARATLSALADLGTAERRALVLTNFASVTMAQMAREVALPPEEAARRLQSGVARIALDRGVASPQVPRLLRGLVEDVDERVQWPAADVVRGAGARRRRTHTAVGVVAAVAVVVGSGALITDASGVRPTLDRAAEAHAARSPVGATAPVLPGDHLLDADQAAAVLPGGGWRVTTTNDNSAGTGRILPCQTARYADPAGDAALVRRLAPASQATGSGTETATGSARSTSVVQLTEASVSSERAEHTYDAVVDWFAGCTTAQTQVRSVRTPVGVGDQALQFTLRSWQAPATTYVVGVARTGRFTTTTVVATPESNGSTGSGRAGHSGNGGATTDPQPDADLLGDAVDRLCTLDGAGSCAGGRPRLVARAPVPTTNAPGLLTTSDLPPVSRTNAYLRRPWQGYPASALGDLPNLAATSCDRTSFSGSFATARFSHATTRTFLIQGAQNAKLPATFGVTETAAALPAGPAGALIDHVESRVGGCEKRTLGSVVTRLGHSATDDRSVTAWRITVQVSDKETVTFVMAIVRNATAVAQVTFLPGGGATMASADFLDLAARARDRLAQLPRPS